MNHLEQDPDGYTSRSIPEMLMDPPESEDMDTRITDTDRALTEKFGSGAAWPPAAPTCISGAAPFWVARWDEMWGLLAKAGYAQKDQLARFRRLADIAQGLRGNTQLDGPALDEFRRLEAAIRPPVLAGVAPAPLWAATTEVGLLLILGAQADLLGLLETGHVAVLRQVPSGAFALLKLDAIVEVLPSQVSYWMWSAAQVGILYRLEPDLKDEKAAQPSKNKAPDMPSVVGSEAPSLALPGRRR